MTTQHSRLTTAITPTTKKPYDALSMEFVVNLRQIKTTSPEILAEGIKRMALRTLARYLTEEMIKQIEAELLDGNSHI